jgi:predicted nucleic acid-binding protein
VLGASVRTLVLDASVAVKWNLTDEEDSDLASLILRQFIRGDLYLVAPEQIRFEVPSAITAATLGSAPRIPPERGREVITDFLATNIVTVRDSDLILDAYPLVHRYGCAFYDALYLALAQRLRVELITADRKLYRRIAEIPLVVWIGDYS